MTNTKLSPHIVKNSEFLTQLSKTRRANKRRLVLLQQATTEQILCLVEICLNILKARLPLKNVQKRQLHAYADTIRRLSRVRSASSAKRIILSSQKGCGSLASYVPILANLIMPILRKANTS